jgi:hypothetical protein
MSFIIAPELKTASSSRKKLANKPVMGCRKAIHGALPDRFSRHYYVREEYV